MTANNLSSNIRSYYEFAFAVDVDRVSAGFWTARRIVGLSIGLASALLLLAVLVVGVILSVLHRTKSNRNKCRVEV